MITKMIKILSSLISHMECQILVLIYHMTLSLRIVLWTVCRFRGNYPFTDDNNESLLFSFHGVLQKFYWYFLGIGKSVSISWRRLTFRVEILVTMNSEHTTILYSSQETLGRYIQVTMAVSVLRVVSV